MFREGWGLFLNFFQIVERLQMNCLGTDFFTLRLGWWHFCTVRTDGLELKLWREHALVFVLEGYTINYSTPNSKYVSPSPFCIHLGSSNLAGNQRLVRGPKHVWICAFLKQHTLSDLMWFLFFVFFRLDEGQYLIAHKAGEPFVTLLKAATGKVSRGAYNLQQLHGSVPQPPASGLLPWVPVDPAVVLPFHKAHGRVPCTFPPKPLPKVCASFWSTTV